MALRNQNSIPAGWRLEHQTDKNKGNILEYYYTNNLKQKFYAIEDLMRYVSYVMKAQLSIYAPPPPLSPSPLPSRTDRLSTAKPCSKEKSKRTPKKSSSKKEKRKKTNISTAKHGGTKKNSIIKFHHIFYRLCQQLNKPTKRRKHANCSAQRQNIKNADTVKTLPHRTTSWRLAHNAPKYDGLDIAATTDHHVPNSPASQSLALTVLPPRASRRLSGQTPEYVPDFDPLLKY